MPDLTQWTVMLVDDEPDSLFLLHDIFALNGAEVVETSSGQEALNRIENVQPTLVVLDLAMPRPDGWDVLAEIRAHPVMGALPVVAVTAFYSTPVVHQAQQAGFDAIFQKPIRASSFVQQLKELVG